MSDGRKILTILDAGLSQHGDDIKAHLRVAAPRTRPCTVVMLVQTAIASRQGSAARGRADLSTLLAIGRDMLPGDLRRQAIELDVADRDALLDLVGIEVSAEVVNGPAGTFQLRGLRPVAQS
jgi:hypothetical protein